MNKGINLGSLNQENIIKELSDDVTPPASTIELVGGIPLLAVESI